MFYADCTKKVEINFIVQKWWNKSSMYWNVDINVESYAPHQIPLKFISYSHWNGWEVACLLWNISNEQKQLKLVYDPAEQCKRFGAKMVQCGVVQKTGL